MKRSATQQVRRAAIIALAGSALAILPRYAEASVWMMDSAEAVQRFEQTEGSSGSGQSRPENRQQDKETPRVFGNATAPSPSTSFEGTSSLSAPVCLFFVDPEAITAPEDEKASRHYFFFAATLPKTLPAGIFHPPRP